MSRVNASLACVIAVWPVIDPLFRFRFAKEFNREEHVKAHIEYWRTEEAMAEGSPQTIEDILKVEESQFGDGKF